MEEKILTLGLKELGSLMKQAREKENKRRKNEGRRELTQGDMAQSIQVSVTTVSDWEQGKKHPGFLNVLKYCEVLKITPDELLGVKKERLFWVQFTGEEKEMITTMIEECEKESEILRIHNKLRFLNQYVTTFFSRAESK